MLCLGFGTISISWVIKSPRSQEEGIRGLRKAQLVQLQHQPLPTSPSLSLLFQTGSSALACPGITAVDIPGAKQTLWMLRDCWEPPYHLFMVSCRVRGGISGSECLRWRWGAIGI